MNEERARMVIDFWNRATRAKMGFGDDWVWCRLEAIGPDTLVTGGVPGTFKSGPRKGKAKWAGVEKTQCVVSRAELRAVKDQYERESGNCHDCCGDGKSVYRVSVDSGSEYKPCARCSGTGKAPV